MATTAEDWENIIIHRLNVWTDRENHELPMMMGLIIRYGFAKVESAIVERAASIHWPDGEGIGTSDISHIVNEVVTGLGEPSIFNKG